MIAKKRQKSAQKKHYKIITRPIPMNRHPGNIYYASKKDKENRKEHEKATAETLVKFGHDVHFIEATNDPILKDNKSNNPDCFWNKRTWELKSPTGSSESTIARNVASAIGQCMRVIIDVSRMQRTVTQATRDTIKYLDRRGGIRWEEIIILDRKEYCRITKNMLK